MGRQCFDLMVHSIHAIPEEEMRIALNQVLRLNRDFDLESSEVYIDKASREEKLYSIPIRVTNPFLISYIGKSMPILVQLFDWYSGVEPGNLDCTIAENALAVKAYELCLCFIDTLEDVVHKINNGNLSRENIRSTIQIYMRIS